MITDDIVSRIREVFGHEPTDDQADVIDSLADFVLNSPKGEIMIISGYAGTGKTSVIAAFASVMRSMRVPLSLLAPTGRAAKVLGGYAGGGAMTIHKRIYRQKSALVESFDLNYNKVKNGLFIVDEASMISGSSFENNIFGSGDLIEDLVRFVNSGDNCRLIIVGDDAQLPPVGSPLSPALDPGTMSAYGTVRYLRMRQVVRQKRQSGILAAATEVRRIIEEGVPRLPKFSLDYDDVKAINGSMFLDELESCYSMYGSDQTVVITRSNKQANRFNEGIRTRVLMQEEELSSGDMVMVVRNNYHYGNGECGLDFIANGDMARVGRVRRYEELHGLRFVEASLTFPDYDDAGVYAKVMLDTLSSVTPSLDRDASQRLFEGLEADYSEYTRKSERYKKIKEDDYYNALQIKFGYAVTCHKAQGGQWSAVFIDRMLWGEEVITIELLRWLYTAITRGVERLYFIGFDDDFFVDPPDYW